MRQMLLCSLCRMLLQPTVTICLQSQKYRFVIYNRKKFLKNAEIENLINK